MPNKPIITGQRVTQEMYQRSRQLRKEMTPAEKKLWQRLRASRLEGFHFRRQQVIARFIVDFYCHQAALVVELDGGVHLDQGDYDRERDNALASLGLQVMRFTNTEVHNNLEGVLFLILDACLKSAVEVIDH